jgi:hypothetical protein
MRPRNRFLSSPLPLPLSPLFSFSLVSPIVTRLSLQYRHSPSRHSLFRCHSLALSNLSLFPRSTFFRVLSSINRFVCISPRSTFFRVLSSINSYLHQIGMRRWNGSSSRRCCMRGGGAMVVWGWRCERVSCVDVQRLLESMSSFFFAFPPFKLRASPRDGKTERLQPQLGLRDGV